MERYAQINSKQRTQSGCPKSITVRHERKIALIANRIRMSTAVAINRELTVPKARMSLTQTLRNRLHDAGLRVTRPSVRSHLTVEHHKRRLHFVQDHIIRNSHHTQEVIRTDESRFCIDFNDSRWPVWRKKNKENKMTYLDNGQSWYGRAKVTMVPQTFCKALHLRNWWKFHFGGWQCQNLPCQPVFWRLNNREDGLTSKITRPLNRLCMTHPPETNFCAP